GNQLGALGSNDLVPFFVPAGSPLLNAGLNTLTITMNVNDPQHEAVRLEGSVTAGDSTATITVGPAAATHFAIATPTSPPTDSSILLTVVAQDRFNNTATSYPGTIHFSSGDTGAVLPADSTLTYGVGTFSATLVALGNQTLTASDTVASTLTGTSPILVIG